MTRRKKMKILEAIVIVGILNFLLFIVATIHDRGDALNGKVEGGRYYLKNKIHYTEVNQAVFMRSLFLGYSMAITFSAGFIAGIFLSKMQREDEKQAPAS